MPRGKVESTFTLAEDDQIELQQEDAAALQYIGYVTIYDPEASGLGQCQSIKGYASGPVVKGSRWNCDRATPTYVILRTPDTKPEISCP